MINNYFYYFNQQLILNFFNFLKIMLKTRNEKNTYLILNTLIKKQIQIENFNNLNDFSDYPSIILNDKKNLKYDNILTYFPIIELSRQLTLKGKLIKY
jgi:hypothetical protein